MLLGAVSRRAGIDDAMSQQPKLQPSRPCSRWLQSFARVDRQVARWRWSRRCRRCCRSHLALLLAQSQVVRLPATS